MLEKLQILNGQELVCVEDQIFSHYFYEQRCLTYTGQDKASLLLSIIGRCEKPSRFVYRFPFSLRPFFWGNCRASLDYKGVTAVFSNAVTVWDGSIPFGPKKMAHLVSTGEEYQDYINCMYLINRGKIPAGEYDLADLDRVIKGIRAACNIL